jgi:phosphoglycerol transferase MdoB-like AlkP superfamily enzyme
LNASVLNYLQDAAISMNMVWQSYPVIWILLGLIVLTLIVTLLLRRPIKKLGKKPVVISRTQRNIWFAVFFILFAAAIFGRINQYPLRWSDAFSLGTDYKAQLALNPFESFFNTLRYRHSSYDVKKIKSNFPVVAPYYGLTADSLNFGRKIAPHTKLGATPNVVLVICESFSGYKSSMWGNPLNTTPYFDKLTKQGVFFDRCFTPAYGTARGVWALITGIPDVELANTASRNPAAVDQHTIINDFNNYEKFYFIGGSASWANIRGLLTNNISNLHLYEQDQFNAPVIDVWGISDKNLLLGSNKVLAQQSKPFFAVIQTAGNHRPYTIPAEDKNEFRPVNVSKDSLSRHGFESNEELNAFRYTDFTFRKFMEAAEKEAYFKNTIFVFVGDHGIRYNGKLEYLPASWTEQGLTCEHVPLLFYAPGRLKPQRITSVCSQVDILPSIASLARISYTNNSMGNNLFDTSTGAGEKYAFIIDHDVHTIGLVSNKYYFIQNLKTGKEDLVSMTNNDPVPVTAETGSLKNYLQKLTVAYYETAKYLLLNNKKKN